MIIFGKLRTLQVPLLIISHFSVMKNSLIAYYTGVTYIIIQFTFVCTFFCFFFNKRNVEIIQIFLFGGGGILLKCLTFKNRDTQYLIMAIFFFDKVKQFPGGQLLLKVYLI